MKNKQVYFLIEEEGRKENAHVAEVKVGSQPFVVIPEGYRTEVAEVVITEEPITFRVVETEDQACVYGLFEANTTEKCFQDIVNKVRGCDGYTTELLKEVLSEAFECKEIEQEEVTILF